MCVGISYIGMYYVDYNFIKFYEFIFECFINKDDLMFVNDNYVVY